MIATYPAETRDEELLLPAMEDRIGKECNDAQLAEFLRKFSDVMGKKSMEQMASLTKWQKNGHRNYPFLKNDNASTAHYQ